MAISRVKTWIEETLEADDLNAEFDNILNNATSLVSPFTAAVDFDGQIITLDAAAATQVVSSAAVSWNFTSGAKAGTPSTSGSIARYSAQTFTDSSTAGSGTATAQVFFSIAQPTLAATNASVTTSDAATWYIAAAPAAGTNQTLTRSYAVWVDAGNVRFDDNIIWLSGTAFAATMEHNNSAARTYTFPDRDLNVGPTLTAEQNLTGTAVDFTDIPAWVRKIKVLIESASTDGSEELLLQLGVSGGPVTTGYVSYINQAVDGATNTVTNQTTGFLLEGGTGAAGQSHHVVATLTLKDATNNTWMCEVMSIETASPYVANGGGIKSLSGALTQLRITTTNTPDDFDAGSAAIMYE